MFCIDCGKTVIEGSRFCGHCGAKLFVPPPSTVAADSPPVPQRPEPSTVEHPSGRDAGVNPEPTAMRAEAPATPHAAPPSPAPRADAAAGVPSLIPPIALPTAEPTPMLFGAVAQPETASRPPAFLLLGGGVGVLLGVGLVIAGFWKTPWLVVPGFLVCVVSFGVMLRRFSRAIAVLGGVLLAVLMTFATGLPFGGIGRLRALRTAIDTAGLPALPAGYQYLTEAGEEIDMVPYVVPERGGEARRSFTFLERKSGGFRMDVVIAPEGEPPTLWRTSGEALRAGMPAPLLTGTIRVAGDLLLSSEGSGDFLFDTVPRRFVPGRWVRVEQSSQRAVFERGGLKVHEMLVGIVACSEAGGKRQDRRSLVVMWRTDLESRETGERSVVYIVSEFTEGVGLSQSGSVKRGERWTASLYRDWVQASQDTEIGKPAVAPQPVAGGEGQPSEPEGSPRPVSDGDTESNGVPVSPSSEGPGTQEAVSICSLRWHLWAFQEVKQRRWRPDPVKRSDNEIEADFFMQAYNACSNACNREEAIVKKASVMSYDDHKAFVDAAVAQYEAFIEDFPALPHFKDANSEATKKRLRGALDALLKACRLSAEAAKASFARWEALGAREEVRTETPSVPTEREIMTLREEALREFRRYVAISDEANDALELRLKAEDEIALSRAGAERR